MAKKLNRRMTVYGWCQFDQAIQRADLIDADITCTPELIHRVYVQSEHAEFDSSWNYVQQHRVERIVLLEHRDAQDKLALIAYDLKQKLDGPGMFFRLSLGQYPLVMPFFKDYLGNYTAEQLADPNFKID
jgi:hypothetical protein